MSIYTCLFLACLVFLFVSIFSCLSVSTFVVSVSIYVYPCLFCWLSCLFVSFRVYWKSDEILRGTLCKIVPNPLKSKGHPLQNRCKSIKIQWNSKGHPLQNGCKPSKFNEILRGTPCKIYTNPPKSNEILKGTPCKVSANPSKFDEILGVRTPCKIDANLWKPMKFQGVPLAK